MPDKIKKIRALEILDSRGDPTVQVTVELSNGLRASAAVPSGASTGIFEAHELRDNDKFRYEGKGVLKAVDNVNKILDKELKDLRVTEQREIDEAMIALDGSSNKSKLGANAILGVSLAVAHAASNYLRIPLYQYIRNLYNPRLKKFKLPVPVVNVINGGMHADTNIEIQEFWIVPIKAKTFAARMQQSSEIFHKLGDLMQGLGMDTDLGNEGGYAPNIKNHKQIFDLLHQAVLSSGYKVGTDIVFGIDAGASVFYDKATKIYNLKLENAQMDGPELIEFYLDLMEKYPLHFLEDPFDEEDWDTWQEFSRDDFVTNNNIKVIGDDLFVTNPKRLAKGIKMGVANSILIKLNQIGSLTETLETIKLARDHDYEVIISHRSGETADTTIADLAVAVNAEYIKTGSVARGERTAKYNRLLNIENELS